MTSVVVIGAGLTGLSTAVRLRHDGHEVTVVDRRERVGGSVGRWEREGHVLDTGPTTLLMPGSYRDLFRLAGADLGDHLDLDPLDPVRRYHFPDGTDLALADADSNRVARTLDETLGEGTGAQWLAVLARGRQIYEAAGQLIPDGSPLPPVSALARQMGELPTFAPHLNLRRLGGQYLQDERLHRLLARYAIEAGADPRTSPAPLVALPYLEHAYGAWTVRGGMYRLPLALAQLAHDLDVRLLLGTGVEAIVSETVRGRSRVARVRTTSGELACAAVVHTGDPAGLRDLVEDASPSPFQDVSWRQHRRRWEPPRRPSSAFSMMLVLRDRIRLGHHEVWLSEDPVAELDSRFGTSRPRPADRPSIAVHAAPGRDGRTQALRVVVDTAAHGSTPQTIDWTTTGLATAYGDHLLTVLADRGLDLRDRIRIRDHRTPADLDPGHGMPLALSWLIGVRRPNVSTPVRGLYLTGGGHPLVSLLAEPMVAEVVSTAVGQP